MKAASNPLWQEAERLRGDGPFDISRVVHSARSRGLISWRDFADFVLAERTAGFGRPLHLLDFFAALTRRLSPRSIIDPYVATPLALAAIADAAPDAQAIGLVSNEMVREIGQAIAPTVEWRFGDPLAVEDMDGGKGRYDLVLAAPPLGLRLSGGPASLTDGPAGNDLAGAILWHSRDRVTPGGRLLFHTSDSLFTERGNDLRVACREAGLHLTTVISVEDGFAPATSIASSVAIFELAPTDQLFVGRLDARTPIPELVDNLLGRRPNRANLHLGSLTSLDYRGWAPFVLQTELVDAFGANQLQAIADLGTVRNISLRAGKLYEPPANVVFVPAIGVGEARTSAPEHEGRNPYRLIELRLDPAKARAEYVAELLSSPIGKRLRESVVTGSTIPHLSAASLATIRIPVPLVKAQDEAISAASHLTSMEAAIARLRGDLWRHPEHARRVVQRLESAAKVDPVRRWLEALPYPLASVLQRYAVSREPEERVQSLVNFFEVTAQFACAVLLSVFRANPELFRLVQADLAKAAPPGRKLLERADFGLWLGLGQTLAKNFRRLADDRDYKDAVRLATGPAEALISRLAEKSFWALLDRARQVRNQRAHGGIVSTDQVASWLGSLETLLGETEQALGASVDEIDLVLVDENRYHYGIYTYRKAQRLRGPNSIFDQFQLSTREPLDSQQLTLVSRDADVSPVLKLVPLVRVGPSNSTSRNACYFFESRHDDVISYVSYHFEDQPHIEIQDTELEQFARQFEDT
jgi:hypothetical protein